MALYPPDPCHRREHCVATEFNDCPCADAPMLAKRYGPETCRPLGGAAPAEPGDAVDSEGGHAD